MAACTRPLPALHIVGLSSTRGGRVQAAVRLQKTSAAFADVLR